MSRWIRLLALFAICTSFAVVALPGCKTDKDAGKPKEQAKGDDHKHKNEDDHTDTGPHGGLCAEWGSGGKEEFHAEFTVDIANKKAVIYILGPDAKTVPKDLDASKIKNVMLGVRGVKGKPFTLQHDPAASGEQGIAYTATDDVFAKPEGLNVNIQGEVNEKPYSGDVKYQAPKKSAANLFLTPGGIYTAADIKANGNTTPDVKLKGIRAKHAKDLNVGDRICPITEKKAQAEIAWIVNGQTYQFCCQPCVENFIEWAHNDTAKVKTASDYVYKGKCGRGVRQARRGRTTGLQGPCHQIISRKGAEEGIG
ncbi:MAG: hypothetical protein HYR84_11605 [Planctomycetes bacterium]|nr:hypothetical protein [Planctomycetota bacterium]